MTELPPNLPTPAEQFMAYLLVLSEETQREVLDSVPPSDFAGAGMAALWAWAGEQPAGTVTAMSLVAAAARIGYPQYNALWLVQGSHAYPAVSLWRDVAAEVRRAATSRRLQAAAACIVEEALLPGAEPEAIAERYAARLTEIAKGGSAANMHLLSDLLPGVMDTLHRMHESSSVTAGVPTGYPALDEVSPLRPGELTILAARPSVGKSALAVNMAANMAEQTWPAAVVSLEMSAAAIAARVLQAHAQAGLKHTARDGTPGAWERITQSSVVLAGVPLTICQPGRLTVSGLRRLCRQCVTQRGARALFVDYLQLVMPDTRHGNRNRENEVAEVSAAAKAVAMDLGVPVVMLAQLNRQAEGEKPKLSHLRDSGSIEQDADAVWFLERDRADKSGATVLTVAKNREGECGARVPLVFRADCTLFVPGQNIYDESAAWCRGAGAAQQQPEDRQEAWA